MPDEKRQQLKDIFDAALKQNPNERHNFINEECGGDEILRTEVESLLSSFDNAGEFMQDAAIAQVADVISKKTIPEKGKCFGQYEIIEQIGVGGMGEVFLAKDKKLDRRVAVKILSEKFSQHEINRARFIQEAKAASSLNHPNILVIHEIGESENIHFIVSEYIEGQTLREIIIASTLNFNTILSISIQIANALAAAHSANLVHRDIKPENIIIRPDDLVKILDFGLAKLTEQNHTVSGFNNSVANQNETAKGVIVGTVKYMSPEQAKGEKVDARTDLFSLGIVIYEMITGKTPFGCESVSETWTKLLHTEPAPLADFTENVPDELQQIIAKMLGKNKDERYQTAKELSADLSALKRNLEFTSEFENRKLTKARNGKQEITEKLSGAHAQQVFDSARSDSKSVREISPAGRNQKTPLNNLTENLFPIVGREIEITEIRNLLQQKNIRLVTMMGVGGTGKTRLAQVVGQMLLPEFADGVFFVKLAGVANHELVVSTVSQSLGVKEARSKPVFEVLKDYLREKQILLVLDNFEQVIDAAPQISELLSETNYLKILITSRTLLHLSAERDFVVPPLAVPSEDSQISLEDLLNYGAIKLFAERVQIVRPNFGLTEENARSVTEICRQLDGLPLAIELAAARLKILSPQAILVKLENRLKLLTGGAGDLPARQQTMRGAVEWSYELLTADEKVLFRQLAVFAGGFLFDAAEAICNIQNDDQILPSDFDILDGITSLVDKSLLVSKEKTDGIMRFRMLEVVREYALESLEANDDAKAVRRRHAAYFLALSEEAEPHLQSGESVKWLNRLEEEHDNLRAALRWSLKYEVKTATRLAAAIRHLWAVHAHLAEGRRWLEAVLEQDDEIQPNIRFKLLNWLGLFALHQGDFEKASEIFEQGLAEGRAIQNLQQISLVSRLYGGMAFKQSDFAAARKFLKEGLEISRELKDLRGIAYSLVLLGDISRVEDDLAAARPLFEESLTILKQLGDRQATSANLCNLGTVGFLEGDYVTAHSYYSETLVIALDLADKQVISYALDGFAALFAEYGNQNSATRLAGAAEHLRELIDSEPELAERRFRDAYLAKLHAEMDETDFAGAYERGRKLTMEEILALIPLQSE